MIGKREADSRLGAAGQQMVQVLMVSSNEDLREMLKVFLASQQYEVISATSSEEAFQFLKRNDPQFMIWDAAPGCEGRTCLDFAEQRQVERILLTTSIDPHETARKLHCMNFLEKPFDPNHLLTMLRKTSDGTRKLVAGGCGDVSQAWLTEVKRDFKPARTTLTSSRGDSSQSETYRFELYPWPRKLE